MALLLFIKSANSVIAGTKVNVIRNVTFNSFLCKNCSIRQFSNFRQSNLLSTLKNSNKKFEFISFPRRYAASKSNPNTSLRKELNIKTNKLNKTQKLDQSHVRRLLSLAKPEKWRLFGAIVLLVISSSVTMAIPFSLGKVLDIIYTSTSDLPSARDKLNEVCLILCGIFILGGICNFGRVYLMSISGQRMTQTLRKSVFSSIVKQEAGWFDSVSTGQLINRLSSDAQLVGSTLSSNISDGLRSLFMVSAGAGMMFYMSSELAMVGLSIVPPIAGLAIIYGRFVRKITSQLQDSLAEATEVAEEKISNIRTVKIFSKELAERNRYGMKIDEVLRLGYKESLARGIFYGMTGLSGNIIIISVLYYGGILVSSQDITVGNLTSFLLYAAYIGVSIGGLSSFYSELNKGIGAAGRLWDIMDRVPAVPVTGGLSPIGIPNGEITFDNVTFSYPSRPEKKILENFTLKIEPGKSLAIVGGSGSGKSTIALLLLRLYEPNNGSVKIDGRDIKELDPTWLRKHIGTVNQEPVLFADSIRNNIFYGLNEDQSENEDELMKVSTLASVHEFVKSLSQGYNTTVGERGASLSGGQRQRIAIARAIIKNPKIIILDEATSALDPKSEHLVREALNNISENRTVLTIAHRLSTIQAADTIAVLQNGSIVEQGSYKELINIENGVFKELVRHQAFQDLEV